MINLENFLPNLNETFQDHWNYTNHVNLEDITMDTSFWFLLSSLFLAIVWIVYLIFYNSRVNGYFITKLVNRFGIDRGYVQIGSITVNALSGKIMFRDVSYITEDYSMRVQDGYLIFRWWRSYVPKDVNEDLSHSDTRLSVVLNGFELHVYNRSEIYAELERKFNLDVNFTGDNKKSSAERMDELLNLENQQRQERCSVNEMLKKQRSEAAMARTWRDLIPVIKVDICSGRLVFGNRLVPTTLLVSAEEAHIVYSTKPAASNLDFFMHFAKCKAENFKVIFAPSPKYTGMSDDPPRYMGEGFVIMSANHIDFYTYMDEPGIVPEEPALIRLANGDVVEAAPPIWGVDIKCGKGTDFSYGPWADRQRDHLFKFFFPSDYLPLQVTKTPRPGDQRQMQSFDIRLSTLSDATVDILFSKDKETNAVHVNIGPGSYLEVTLPWIVFQDGYTTSVTGQLLHVEATTSLQYRSLFECETLEYNLKVHFPIFWNDHQDWTLNLTGCKTTGNFIYSHINFFQDLVNDWVSKARPDVLHFVPYTWKIGILLKEFELILVANEYNWIDCSSHNQENSFLAFCGDVYDMSFDLPFAEFLPNVIPLNFWIQGECVDMSLFVPEIFTIRNIIFALNKNAKILSRDGRTVERVTDAKKWRNVCTKSNGWVDCWSVPIVALCINYSYHPIPPLGPTPQADISTPDKEELLLSPIRFPHSRKSTPVLHWASQKSTKKFDPETLPADKVSLELEIGPSTLHLYGIILRMLMNLKENIFGEDQLFTDMQQSRGTDATNDATYDDADSLKVQFDARYYRPIEVHLQITIHDIQAHLMKNCTDADPPCPVVWIERLGVEMKKTYRETLLQVLVSPSILSSNDNVARGSKDAHINQGHLVLSSLQIRGHAMFSDESRTLDEDTVEYAWLIEIQMGKLNGKLTAPQLFNVVTSLETLFFTTKNSENNLRPPRASKLCLHGEEPFECPNSPDNDRRRNRCPSTDDVKYQMTRVGIDVIDVHLIECGTSVQVFLTPVRFTTCNLHGEQVKAGITCLIPCCVVRQFISTASHFSNTHSNTNTTSSSKSNHTYKESRYSIDSVDHWVEVGAVNFGPVIIETALSMSSVENNLHVIQNKFLKQYDEKTKRLWFLWPTSDINGMKCPLGAMTGKCGCIGGCAFFGTNRNGARFFKPHRNDVTDGVNTATFKISDNIKDPGYGQSILHENQLVFHTPPYSYLDVQLQEPPYQRSLSERIIDSPRVRSALEKDKYVKAIVGDQITNKSNTTSISPLSQTSDSRQARRFSYTSTRGPSGLKDVPYARLLDSSPTSSTLPLKLDDSKRNSTSVLSVPESEFHAKNSVSDSKLSTEYLRTGDFYTPADVATKLVNISESHHSLSTGGDRASDVQRTVSMTSENYSEAFFSADEDMANSRASSLRRTTVREDERKKFASDTGVDKRGRLSHYPDKTDRTTNPIIPDLTTRNTRLSSYRSDHEIHTPEHRSSSIPSQFNQPASVQATRKTRDDVDSTRDTSDTPSLSSTSFISAVSSQEDMTLVNLHMQVNKPIVESPLLMSSYLSHLSQVRCANWTQAHLPTNAMQYTAPLYQKLDDEHLVYTGARYMPKFEVLTDGFTSMKMIARDSLASPPCGAFKTPTHPYVWNSLFFGHMGDEEVKKDGDDELLGVTNHMGSKMTIILKLNGDLDVMVTPLMLESLQRFIDAITPSLSKLHPLTVINHLHNECVNEVESANFLKQDQSLAYWSQIQASKNSTAERNGIALGANATPAIQSNVYEEIICTELQGSVIVPKVNITFLQACVVEEIISFSALDNFKDLTCVSLMALCFENINMQFHRTKQVREVIQTFHHPSVLPVPTKKTIIANLVRVTNRNKSENPTKPAANVPINTPNAPTTSASQSKTYGEMTSRLIKPNETQKFDGARGYLSGEVVARAEGSIASVSIDETMVTEGVTSDATKATTTCGNVVVGGGNTGIGTSSNRSKLSATQSKGKAFLAAVVSRAGLRNTKQDKMNSEPVFIETQEKQYEETIVTLNVGKIHAQLRRLKNESTILKDAVITAIPIHHSKVLFTCTRVQSPRKSATDVKSTNPFVEELTEEKLGFIMFEGGLEGVCLKIVKKTQFERNEDDVIAPKAALNLSASGKVHGDGEEKVRSVDSDEKTLSTITGQTVFSVGGLTDVPIRQTQSTDAIVQPTPKLKNLTDKIGVTPAATSSSIDSSATIKDNTQDNTSNVTNTSTIKDKPTKRSTNNGNTSSGIIELKVVWFNFAAPPRAPITRKLDYTRLDWNLLSTTSPAINAWLNPSNRFAIRTVHMSKCYFRRVTSAVASLMAEALDVPSIHQPIKSRYNRLTPLAKTLKEDPSCQLCTILQKYVWQSELNVIEANLNERDLPSLSTLRQGVIVLSRQWKNVLYTPLLLEHNYKTKYTKPLNVTFAVPEVEQAQDTEMTGVNAEMDPNADECAVLLTNNCPNSRLSSLKIDDARYGNNSPKLNAHVTVIGGVDGLSPSLSTVAMRKHILSPTQNPSSTRASVVFPITTSSTNPFLKDDAKSCETNKFNDERTNRAKLLDSTQSVYSNGSQYSTISENFSPKSSRHAIDLTRAEKHSSTEDLYSWMAKQQTYIRDKLRRDTNVKKAKVTHKVAPVVNAPPDGGGTAQYNVLYPIPDSLKLLDAHIIFQPLLTSLAVLPQHMLTSTAGNNTELSLDTLGSNLSLVGSMETLRIDIVVSQEHGKRGKTGTGKKSSKFHLDIPSETPAFLSEKIGLEMELNKVADMTVDEMIHKQNVLYISRGQLKRHTSTVLNVSFNIHYISQQVNMPLLRLLHQITNMYQNFKETQLELKEQQIQPHLDVKRSSSNHNDHNDDDDEFRMMNRSAKNESSSISDIQEPLTISLDQQKRNIPSSLKVSQAMSTSRPTISPSPSIRSRPQSFAQKLRQTSKNVKGYMNLHDGGANNHEGGGTSPILPNSPTGSAMDPDHITISSDKSVLKDALTGNVESHAPPKCWKTVYYLLDLYATMPETKTITHRFSIAPDVSEHYKGNRKYDLLTEVKSVDELEKGATTNQPTPQPVSCNQLNILTSDRTRLVIFGVARIHRTRLLATLSGLKLEAEITNLHSSLTVRKKSRPVSLECSLTGQVGRTMIVLLEGVAPNQQTVVKINVGKSQALYSTITRKGKDKNSGLLTVGAVNIDIPQHPVALHDMMTRGSKQLSSTLQELRVTRTSSRMSRGMPVDEESPYHRQPAPFASPFESYVKTESTHDADLLLQPLVMQFSIILQSLSITAALLPSLQAQYKMDQVNSTGTTGGKAKFTIDLPQHSLSFTTKLPEAEANLPSEASIALPKVHVLAEYIHQDNNTMEHHGFADGAILRQGSYISATADIGMFVHSLTTDLLNHLVFVQKVFMREVNEVLQKVYGAEKPVAIWLDDSHVTSTSRLLFSLVIRVKSIQITATTPTNSAVRLETGKVELELSNRVQNISGTSTKTLNASGVYTSTPKLFGRANVDLNLSLGQLIRNVLFDEVEPEFQQFAFFNTRIELRNAFQDEMIDGEDKEVVLITLNRPLIYFQPLAVDKAILVWLNYKNAYEYWTEKRSNLNKEVLTATQQVFEKVQLTSQLSSQHLGTLFLQLTVEDMGICLPLNPLYMNTWNHKSIYDTDSHAAVVITLERTSISACSSGSLVSKAGFVGLCLRFADDFETTLDDWKPDMNDMTFMNYCVVSEGTYEICSRTIAAKQANENAKWFLNVSWKMEGVDIHFDVNIGKQLSALGHTLTMLAGVEEDEPVGSDSDDTDQLDGSKASHESILPKPKKYTANLPAFIYDQSLDSKKRSKLIEKELNEQAKIINDLRSLGASKSTIDQEMKKLHELEAIVFKDFRRDMIQKLKRQSSKAAKDDVTTTKATANRSRSFIIPSPMPEHYLESTGTGPNPAPLLATSAPANTDFVTLLSTQTVTRGKPSTPQSTRVTFSENIHRQSSLPSTSDDAIDDDWTPHMDIDGEKVRLRHKNEDIPEHATHPAHHQSAKTQEPNIDFELDVKVLINCGKCVLHTKDSIRDEEIRVLNRMKKERSCSSAGIPDWINAGSPSRTHHMRTGSGDRSFGHNWPNTSSGARIGMAAPTPLTVFHIPAMDVRIHYKSYTSQVEKESSRKTGVKKASLFAWMTLQSIPEETIITPNILDFLEQTLEPIATKPTFPSMMTSDESTIGVNYVYASFPVDVIVYFHMQPSTFRFSCLPVSRVECLLQLPSLDIVFSSKRADETFGMTPSGGLSVTGCLADFNVYIFHPYGGQKKSSGLKEPKESDETDRKDSLSINVEFIKFHLSRSKRVNVDPKIGKLSDQSRACIHFSTIIDIGSASFKYDMRRLTEILAFPRAWYRSSIFRRLFLGDLSVSSSTAAVQGDFGAFTEWTESGRNNLNPFVDAHGKRKVMQTSAWSSEESNTDASNVQGNSLAGSTTGSWETLVLFAVNFTKLNVHMNMGNVMGNVTWQTKDFRSEGRLRMHSSGYKNMFVRLGLDGSGLDAKGGIVGGTIELANIDTFSHFKEEPHQEPDHTVGLKLLAFELRLDYMGTSVLMSRVSSLTVTLRDEWKLASKHSTAFDTFMPTRRPAVIFMHGDLAWDQLQLMVSKSTAIDLMKICNKLEEFFSQQFKSSKRVFSSLEPGAKLANKKPASSKAKKPEAPMDAWTSQAQQQILHDAKHHRHWQKVLANVAGLHLPTLKIPLPNSGTVLGGTMELHGRNISLACFHGINFKSKSWALFSLKEPSISFNTEAQEVPSCADRLDVHIVQTLTFGLGMNDERSTAQHESMATVCRLSRTVIFPPQYKTLQEWFQYAFAASEIDCVERFPLIDRDRWWDATIASNSIERSRSGTQANVAPVACKTHGHAHQREVIFALPTMQLNLKTEHLQTANIPNIILDEKPVVECSFVTEFEDHIFVTVDAEAFFFLHDLITSYIREKDRMTIQANVHRPQSPDFRSPNAITSTPARNTAAAAATHQNVSVTDADADDRLSQTNDWRAFVCKTWHLEPTVRLLSWGGQSIEPYGIDYILQKLGFNHARTTIPKWMQRGFMDPLDKVLALLMLRMVANGTLQKHRQLE